jgi:hypothetical protein
MAVSISAMDLKKFTTTDFCLQGGGVIPEVRSRQIATAPPAIITYFASSASS